MLPDEECLATKDTPWAWSDFFVSFLKKCLLPPAGITELNWILSSTRLVLWKRKSKLTESAPARRCGLLHAAHLWPAFLLLKPTANPPERESQS